MRKGEIIYCHSFKFPDGGESEKLLINLNDPAPGEPYLLMLTTSKQHKKLNAQGCHPGKGYYVIPKNKDFFVKDFTWVLFNTAREWSLTEELREGLNKNFITKGFLKNETLRAIINCYNGSDLITGYRAALLK